MGFVVNQAELSLADKREFYMKGLKPFILKEALFADGTNDYVRITEDKIVLRFRTGKNNVDFVYLNMGDSEILMEKNESEGFFDYYTAEVDLPDQTTPYYFKVVSGKCVLYYNNTSI